MPTKVPDLVVDIETVGVPWDSIDDADKQDLLRGCYTDAEREAVLDKLAIWPLTGFVVAIGMRNVESGKSLVLYLNPEVAADPAVGSQVAENDDVGLLAFVSEKSMLVHFWAMLMRYGDIITFNGRGFDMPFLYHRSAILGSRISRKNLCGYRYSASPHCDLLDQLTYYGAMRRRFTLGTYCRAYGIESSKGEHTGADVGAMYAAGRYAEIAEYCAADCAATAQLYKVWKERLAA